MGKARKKRREAMISIIMQLEEIRDAEKQYWDNIPITPPNGERYQEAEQAVNTIEEAVCLLYQAY
jgi:hypothetical protein